MSSQIPNSNDPFSVPSLQNSASASSMPGAVAPGMSTGSADGDGIEPEWLDRTHHVMQSFAADPYQLSKEFAVVRAEYIKHRYGKVLKANTKKEGDH